MDYTSIDIDAFTEDICRKIGIDYETHKDTITDTLDEYFGQRLREHSVYVGQFEEDF